MTLTARLSSAAEIERDSANSNSNFAGRLRLALVYLGEKIRLVRPHWIPLGIIILAGLVVLTWFRGFMLYHWDTVFPFNPSAAMKAFFWPWSDLISTGTPVLGSVSLPYFLLIYVAQDVLGLSSLDSQILLYYSLLTLAGVSMYTFFTAQVRNERKSPSISRIGALACALVYMFNLYAMVYLWMIFSQEAFLYATLPLLILLFQKGLERNRIEWKVVLSLAGVSLFALPGLGIPAFSIPVVCGFAVFYALWLMNPSNSRKRVQSIRFVAVSSLSLLLIHIWWIYPTAIFYGSQLTRAGGSSFGAVGLSDLMSNSAHTDYFNLIRLAGMFPLYNSDRYPHYSFAWMYQTLSPIMLVSLMTPIIAFLALILKGTKLPRMIQLFAATCVLGVIPVAAGTQPPFGGLFEWLALNIPSFSILFRDPYQKFGFWIPFGYSLLIGSCFLTVVGREKRESEANPNPDVKTGQHRSFRRVAVLGIILTLVTTGLVWPMFTGDVIPTESPVLPSPRVQVPGYYYDATSWLLSQKGSFRILSLPEDQILQSSNWSHGYAASDILRYLTGDSIISTSPQVSDLNVFQHNLYSYIYGGGANLTKILKALDVRFIVLRMDAGFYPTVTQQVNLTQLRIYLDNQNGLDLSREFGPLLFFEARDYGPKVSVAGEALTLSQLNRVGWSIHDYSEGWQTTSLNMSASNSDLSFAFDPHGTYSYGYATTSQPLNLSIEDFSYLKVQFSSSSNGALLLHANFDQGPSVWLTAIDDGSATSYMGNHYSSTKRTTMTYDLLGLAKDVKSLDIFVTNSPQPYSSSLVNVTIYSLTLESYIGQPLDYLRAIAKNSDSRPLAIVESSGITNQGSAQSPPDLTYDQVSPVQYMVKLTNIESRFVLVLSETFDDQWHLEGPSAIDPSKALHVKVDGFENGWIISVTGNLSISIVYGPGESVVYGYYASFVGGLAIFLFAIRVPTIDCLRKSRRVLVQ